PYGRAGFSWRAPLHISPEGVLGNADEQFRYLPGGEVTAVRDLVVEVDQVEQAAFRPDPGRADNLPGEHRDADGQAERRSCGDGVLPVEPRRGRRCVGEPVQGDVVQGSADAEFRRVVAV